eukprot:Rhum_TRINITY_DN14863_c3_g1::Rhum_TRINITY_DN14863_c3_g1_i1::g.123627::m.123627
MYGQKGREREREKEEVQLPSSSVLGLCGIYFRLTPKKREGIVGTEMRRERGGGGGGGKQPCWDGCALPAVAQQGTCGCYRDATHHKTTVLHCVRVVLDAQVLESRLNAVADVCDVEALQVVRGVRRGRTRVVDGLVLLLRQQHRVRERLLHTRLQRRRAPPRLHPHRDGLRGVAAAVADGHHVAPCEVGLLLGGVLHASRKPRRQRRRVEVAELRRGDAAQRHLLLQQPQEAGVAPQHLCHLAREHVQRRRRAGRRDHLVRVGCARLRRHLRLKRSDVDACLLAQAQEHVALGHLHRAHEPAHEDDAHGLDGHHLVRPVQEDGLQPVEVRAGTAGAQAHVAEHVLDGVDGGIRVHRGAVRPREDREVRVPRRVLRPLVAEVPRHRLAEVGAAIRRRRPSVAVVDGQQLRVLLDKHGDGAGALRRLAGGAALVLRDVRRDDDGLLAAPDLGVPAGVLQGVHAAEARVLELRHLDVARQASFAELVQRSVDHALHNDGAGRVVRRALRAQPNEADVLRVDVVRQHQVQHGVGRHCVRVLVRPRDAEAAADHVLHLVPLVARPLAPVLQVHLEARHVHARAADTDLLRKPHRRDPKHCRKKECNENPMKYRY